MTDLVN